MSEDTGPMNLPRLRVTRDVPVWALLSLLALGVSAAVTGHFGQQRMLEKQTEMASDLRAIVLAVGIGEKKDIEFSYQLQALEQRMRAMEQRKALP